MGFIDVARVLVSNNEIKEASTDFLGDAASGLLGDPISIGKIIISVASSPFFIRDKIFWAKFECFLSGLYASDEDRAKFCAKLCENGKEQENAVRVLDCIDHVETNQKVRYLINASRSVSAGFISLTDYFRICNAIKNNIQEDLQFLADNIKEKDISYSPDVQGLLSSGVMYQSIMDANGNQKYSFTPLGKMLDRFAVSYDDVIRYPNPMDAKFDQSAPELSIPALEWQNFLTTDDMATDEDVNAMLDEIYKS